MRCLVCHAQMRIQDGRYGEFYYCPNGQHGTLSVEKYKAIMSASPREEYAPDPHTNVEEMVDRQCTALGRRITEIEAFFVDNEAFYEDPDDFWKNVRPY